MERLQQQNQRIYGTVQYGNNYCDSITFLSSHSFSINVTLNLQDGYGQEIVTFRTLRRSPLTPIVKKLSRDARLSTSANSMSGCSSSDDTDSDAETDAPNVEKVRKNRAVVYWISYIEKKQRVLLFTQDENIFLKAKSIVDPECSRREIFCALAGIALSIVSN